MDGRYGAYCVADPLFYDVLRSAPSRHTVFKAADRELPDGWFRGEQGDWVVHSGAGQKLPAQGWKIHGSAGIDNAERIVEAVWEYCIAADIAFKFLRSVELLWLRNSKYALRGHSGKLVTIYPVDEFACAKILTELGALLDGEPGPYILSDLRWGRGPLHVRYGAFATRYCLAGTGQLVPAIADGTGRLVPDRREPAFHLPAWVKLPDFLAPHLAARNAVTVAHLPYSIESAIHFSNGGGLYRGRQRDTGAEVVLKEARPHAGLDAGRADAVTRLTREYEMLQRLAGVPGIPRVHQMFTLDEHRFMAMEYIDGISLNKAIVRQHPLIDIAAGPADFARYTEWALGIVTQVEATVGRMHERGVVHGDLHLSNVVVRADGSVVLLDFEVATLAGQHTRPALGNQGFAPPAGVTGVDVDRYALACLRLAMFLPITHLLWLSRAKAASFAEVIGEHFPVPPEFLATAVQVIAPDPHVIAPHPPVIAPHAAEKVGTTPAPRREGREGPRQWLDRADEDWPGVRDRIVAAIRASATPDRDDRLFPGDIEQFRVGGLGLAHGAAGVLYALAATGAGRDPQWKQWKQWEQWLVRHGANPPEGTPLGLYDGLHGVAFTLDYLGYRQEALDTLERCLAEQWRGLGLDLFGGVTGIGLNLLHLAHRTGEPALHEAARQVAEVVADRLGDETSVDTTSGHGKPYAGLLHGSSGPALLLMRMYDETGDAGYLDRAAVALRQDLRRCLVRDNGTMEVNEGSRGMPYLARGSAGIGLALAGYLAHRDDPRFAEAALAIRRAAQARLYAQSGLFAGRAGILLYLAHQSISPRTDPDVIAQLRALAWHELEYGGGIAFPGDQLLRLSMDLGTGTAGVLLALGAALHDEPVSLPLLTPDRKA